MNGQQGGDPAKLAAALVTLSDSGDLPLRFVAGADAMAAVEANLRTIQDQIEAEARQISWEQIRAANAKRQASTRSSKR